MAKARERAVWERIVAEVGAGLSQREAAARYGVSAAGVGHWVRRLREEKEQRATPQLLPVRLTPSPAMSTARRRCALVIDDVHVEFEEGVEPGYIAAVARALRA